MGMSSDRFILVFKNAATLPVRFTKVAAQKKDDGIAVSWQTANVSGVKDFDVERSADGVSFAKVNSVEAVNTSGLHDYAIVDKQPLTGWNYYRIRSNDVSGSYTYSSVVKAQWLGNAQIRFYPNVITNGKINLLLQDQLSGRYHVVLNTLSGQRVYSSNLQHVGGTASYSLELKNGKKGMAAGEYILVIYSGAEMKQTEKVVIQ
jgi:hypothetical protein